MISKCVLYSTYGKNCTDEAIISAESFKEHNPNIDIVLITDWFDKPVPPFDKVLPIEIKEKRHLTKVRSIANFDEDYDLVLYLDSDTFTTGNLDKIFQLLSRFHIALAHAPVRRLLPGSRIDKVPNGFTDFNSGVIFYRRVEMEDFFHSWYQRSKLYEADQIGLCELLYGMDWIQICTLSPEYNARVGFPCYFQGEVKILHARLGKSLSDIASEINKSKKMRLWNREEII